MTSRRIYTIGHVDHGKTMLTAAITLLLARPAAPDATSEAPETGTDGPQSGPVVNPKPIDTQPGETL